MSEQIRVLGRTLRALCAVQEDIWSRSHKIWNASSSIDDDTYNTYTELISNWMPLTEKDMEAFFPSNSKAVDIKLSTSRKALYLSPTINQPHLIPVVSLECIIDNTRADLKIRMMLIQKRNGALEGIGFRFENGDNVHAYYHAQLINELKGSKSGSNPVIQHLDWLPESEPAIPVKANDPVTLLLCSLISLYGFKNCSKLASDYQISELTKYLGYFAEPNEKPKGKKKK